MPVTLTQTTLSGALSISDNVINVASASGIAAPTNQMVQKLYLINPETTRGELVTVTSVTGTQIGIARLDKFRQGFLSGSIVIIGSTTQYFPSFFEFDPVGVVSAVDVPAIPWINVDNGNQWLRSVDGLWIPGFNNPNPIKGISATVASPAGAITPSGPMMHVSGTNAITGITIPVGFSGGQLIIIPDGNFTWTTAGNIALAGTAVTGRVLVFTYDSNAAKPFYPSYV